MKGFPLALLDSSVVFSVLAKLAEDGKIVALERKLFEEISDEVIFESLKTLFVEEVQKQSAEKATMMDIDREAVPETIIVEFI